MSRVYRSVPSRSRQGGDFDLLGEELRVSSFYSPPSTLQKDWKVPFISYISRRGPEFDVEKMVLSYLVDWWEKMLERKFVAMDGVEEWDSLSVEKALVIANHRRFALLLLSEHERLLASDGGFDVIFFNTIRLFERVVKEFLDHSSPRPLLDYFPLSKSNKTTGAIKALWIVLHHAERWLNSVGIVCVVDSEQGWFGCPRLTDIRYRC